jgi:hypothetical protein
MSDFDKIIFGKTKFSDLLEEIYDNQKKKARQISALITELKPLVGDIGDATLIVPLIKLGFFIIFSLNWNLNYFTLTKYKISNFFISFSSLFMIKKNLSDLIRIWMSIFFWYY